LDGASQLKKVWVPLGAGAVTFFVGFLPILRMLLGNDSDVPSPRSLENIQKYSSDVFGFLIPSWNHVLLGRFAQHLDLKIFTAGYEGTVYTGPVILILTFVGFARGMATHPRWTLRATVAVFVFYLLSLGPRLRFFGWQSEIPGPALLLYESRFTRFLSSPARFDVIVMLGAAILCALGCAYLLDHRTELGRTKFLPLAIVALLLADLLTVPFPNNSSFDRVLYPDSAAIMRPCKLPADAQAGTVLTLPLQEWPYNVKAMAMQMADDGRYALIDGYISYASDSVWSQFQRFPILRSLIALQSTEMAAINPNAGPGAASPSEQGHVSPYVLPGDPLVDRETAAGMVRELNLNSIVVFDSARREAAIRYIEDVFGRQTVSAGSCSVFDLRLIQPASRNIHSGGQQ
jgi:hypothetical protein